MKQILTARECAKLNRRLWVATLEAHQEGRCLGGSAGLHQSALHPFGNQQLKRLPSVIVSYVDGAGNESHFAFLSRSNSATKAIRKYLFETLPDWPDADRVPAFDGLMDDDCSWYSGEPEFHYTFESP